MKGKLKTVFVSLSLAFLFLLACAFPMLGGFNAAAAENDEPTSGHLYYFSDSAESAARCREFVSDGLINTYTLYYYTPDKFADTFRKNFDNSEYSGISNSYVIFEMASAGFPTEIDDGTTKPFPCVLADFFSYLKTTGCKIIFISATDEAHYIHYNDFLDYVDIHVKTDIFFKFITSVLYHAAQDCENGGLLWGTTFFLDAGLIDYENLQPLSQ